MQIDPTATRTPGATLRSVREAHGLTLRQTAAAAGIDPAQLSRVERGRQQLSIDALYRLAGVLGLRELRKMIRPYVREVA